MGRGQVLSALKSVVGSQPEAKVRITGMVPEEGPDPGL